MNPPRPVHTLDDLAGENGTFAIIAMDQRNTLRRMFTAVGREGTDDELRQVKVDVARELTDLASGLLSDPTYGIPAIKAAGALAPTCGLLVAAEPAERRVWHGEPRTHRDPELDAKWVLDLGGQGLKFFVQMRGDRPSPASGEPDLVEECVQACREVIADCRATGVPVVIENMIYPIPGQDLNSARRETAIIESARVLNDLDVDLLKLEYPGSPRACRKLAGVLTRPWAVLSAGVPFEQFQDVMRTAFVDGGAAGFIAGRSVWRDAVALAGADRDVFLRTVARTRLVDLVAVANRYASGIH